MNSKQEEQASFKPPPRKYQPSGLTILFEDHDIIIVDKINGLLTVSTDRERDKTAFSLLNNYVRKGNSKSKNRVFIVHRLDKDTSGVLVFAKTAKAKEYLQEHWPTFDKTYFAIVYGHLKEKKGIITSHLLENKAYRMYSSKDPNQGKLSKTGYQVIKTSKNLSLLKIDLFTGRKHQIRVHLSEMGHPVVGDKVYGAKGGGSKRLALHASTLTITHPFTQEKMTFEAPQPLNFKTII